MADTSGSRFIQLFGLPNGLWRNSSPRKWEDPEGWKYIEERGLKFVSLPQELDLYHDRAASPDTEPVQLVGVRKNDDVCVQEPTA